MFVKDENCVKMLNIEDHIEVNPKVLMGKPVVKGTRISVESLLERLSAGETESDIIKAHPHITRENIKAALAFAAQSLKGESIYPIAS